GGDLYRLFNNLIENAVVHGSNAGVNGDPRVTGARVRLSVGHAAGNVEVQVADNGPGIPPDERERVFERFYRSPGNEGPTNGTGLGLSIAMQIVRTHQGHIAVGSREGIGCVITVTLPGVDRPSAAAQ